MGQFIHLFYFIFRPLCASKVMMYSTKIYFLFFVNLRYEVKCIHLVFISSRVTHKHCPFVSVRRKTKPRGRSPLVPQGGHGGEWWLNVRLAQLLVTCAGLLKASLLLLMRVLGSGPESWAPGALDSGPLSRSAACSCRRENPSPTLFGIVPRSEKGEAHFIFCVWGHRFLCIHPLTHFVFIFAYVCPPLFFFQTLSFLLFSMLTTLR